MTFAQQHARARIHTHTHKYTRTHARVLASWSEVSPPSQQELGYTALLEIVSELRQRG